MLSEDTAYLIFEGAAAVESLLQNQIDQGVPNQIDLNILKVSPIKSIYSWDNEISTILK